MYREREREIYVRAREPSAPRGGPERERPGNNDNIDNTDNDNHNDNNNSNANDNYYSGRDP